MAVLQIGLSFGIHHFRYIAAVYLISLTPWKKKDVKIGQELNYWKMCRISGLNKQIRQ